MRNRRLTGSRLIIFPAARRIDQTPMGKPGRLRPHNPLASCRVPSMTQNRLLRTACLLAAFLFLPCPGMGAPATGKPLRDIVLTMPAETVLASLQKVLPLTIPSQSSQLQGQIVLESLDKLFIHDNILSVQGVLTGKTGSGHQHRWPGRAAQARPSHPAHDLRPDHPLRSGPPQAVCHTQLSRQRRQPKIPGGLAGLVAQRLGRPGIRRRSRRPAPDQHQDGRQIHPHLHGAGQHHRHGQLPGVPPVAPGRHSPT